MCRTSSQRACFLDHEVKSRTWHLNCRYHLAINRLFYHLLDSLLCTASCILLCLWYFEDNCSVIWCVFCWWKGIGPMHRHCCAYIACVQSLYAERVGRPRVVNSYILLHVHEPWHVSGGMRLIIYFRFYDRYIHVISFTYICHFVSLWIQFNTTKWRPMFFGKLFLFISWFTDPTDLDFQDFQIKLGFSGFELFTLMK
jgi:hypothetical protein